MTNLQKYLLAALIGAVLAFLAMFGVARCTRHDADGVQPSAVRDTLVIRDTVRIEKPVAKYIRTTDTIYVCVSDTVRMRDTMFVRLPVEQREYSDSLYRLQVSGYRPQLDWIEVYPTTVKVTETQTVTIPKKTRWGIGVQVGYGATLHDKQVVLSPYVGLGVSYHFICW